jgi:hypothetical protein
MKKTILVAIVATTLFACSAPAENKGDATVSGTAATATGAASCVKEGSDVDLIKKTITAYSTGDWATLSTCFVDTAKSYHNNDTVAMKMSDRIELFKKQRANIDGAVDAGTPNIEVVTVANTNPLYEGIKWGHAWITFTSKVKGGAKKSSLTFVSFAIKDGKILQEQVIYDTK